MDKKKLLTRAFSGIIYVAIIVGCILCGEIGVAVLGIAFAILATIEFNHITGSLYRENRSMLMLDILGVILLSVAFNPLCPLLPLLLWIVVMICRFVVQLYAPDANPLKDLAHSMMSQIYIGLPLTAMSLAAFSFHPVTVLMVFILLWINDTGAYLVGSLLGRHRLFERISPKKSWEGFFGGLAFSIVTTLLFAINSPSYLGIHLGISSWIGLGIVITVFGTWGDLVESMLKRHLHIKDSGNIIPGHGGILDRIDSFQLAMPAALVYLVLLTMFA